MEYDEKIGYGSNYEKFILRGIFRRLIEKYRLGSVLEYPANHLMGRHEEIFEGLAVKINPATADLVWNFCEFERNDNPRALIDEMTEKSKKFCLIITGNKRNPGVILHRLWHLLIFKRWDHGRFWQMDFGQVKKVLRKCDNLEIKKVGAFDIPWFLLDVYECGNFFKKLIPLKSQLKEFKPTVFERYPFFWQKYYAHHFYLLIEKR